MRVVVAGGHGQIALRLTSLLAARGDSVVGIVRNPDHIADVRALGGDAVVLDLEAADVAEVAGVLDGADAVVFAAGAGPGSGAARKDTVDRGASVLLASAAEAAGVRRYLQISSINLDRADEPGMDPVFASYLRAKAAADDHVMSRSGRSGLDWTILRPGVLTNEAGTGLVRLAPSVAHGSVTRDDVAAVLVGLLDRPATAGLVLELVAGDDSVDVALGKLA